MANNSKKKPLTEAAFALRWGLDDGYDPDYNLYSSKLYERLKDTYPNHEESLVTKENQDGKTVYQVEHTFRKREKNFPVIRIVPGDIAISDSDNYSWNNFNDQINYLINSVYTSHPNLDNLKINGILLQYTNAIRFNFNKSTLSRIEKYMGIGLHVNDKFFIDSGVSDLFSFEVNLTYESSKPKGIIMLNIQRGDGNQFSKLIWNIGVYSAYSHAPQTKDEIYNWADQAHILIKDWYGKITEGELSKRY